MDRHCLRFTGMLCGLLMLGAGVPALAVSHYTATAPVVAKSAMRESFRLAPGTVASRSVALAAIAPEKVLAAKTANSQSWNKRLQIGIGRDVPKWQEAGSAALLWMPVSGGLAAHWEVTSAGARALRLGLVAAKLPSGIEIRFAGEGDRDTVYGPFAAADVIAMGATFWSPVLEGERAFVEVFLPADASPFDAGIVLAQVSHLFASPSQADVEILAKAAQFCEVDLVCRSATDEALARTGNSVARMTFSDGTGGGTYLCTGTLLNPADGSFTPYFYSANHCIGTQASASTLTTHWFYDRVGCGSGGTSPGYTQLAGGATLLYANEPSDALLLRLNTRPPAGAAYAGWEIAPVSTGAALTAVHHPAGDLKKVSLATSGGFGSPGSLGGPSGSFVISRWNSVATGVTEGGSSGSGIFTPVGQPASDYWFRGGLWGGPSSCSAPAGSLYDYYSRFDQVYPAIAQFLDPITHYYRSILRRPPDAGGKAFWEGEISRVRALGASVNEVWFTMSAAFYASIEYAAFDRDNAAFVTDLYGTFFNRAPDAAGLADWLGQLAAGMPREVVLTSFMFSPEFAGFTQAIFGTTKVRGEIDVVGDFYRGLLARLPDNDGFSFWVKQFRTAQCQGAFAVTAQAESMSRQFAQSGEYQARSRSNGQYVGDLYNAFLRRGGELAGVQFWIAQLDTGARTREGVRQAFVGSPEFQARVAAIIAEGCLQ